MKYRILLILTISLLTIAINAQQVKKVHSEYTYYASENISLEDAKRTALERAKIQAIADEFGTIISQSNTSIIKNGNGKSTSDFLSLSESDVKGEWIETLDKPVFEPSFKDGYLIVTVKISGRIREITTSQVNLIAKVLCNGMSDQNERTEFKNGDDLFLKFQSPVDGYLTVYLVDAKEEIAYCLLPYKNSSDPIQNIEHDKNYIFFSQKDGDRNAKDVIDEYTMTCSNDLERNDLYILFSPNSYFKANSENLSETCPRQLSWGDFQKWLAKVRRRDSKLQVEHKVITITN